MNDEKIVSLFESRDENAIQELSRKYGNLCYKVAWNILGNREDCEECVNDTWFSVWSLIPSKKPYVLSAFTCRITRSHAIDCSCKKYADKRMDGEVTDETMDGTDTENLLKVEPKQGKSELHKFFTKN